jgi:hypothetical protein
LRISQENEMFKQDVKDEIQELRQLLSQSSSILDTSSSPQASGSTHITSNVSLPSPSNSTNTATTAVTTPLDVQTQMMVMLTESFSKLLMVLQDKSSDSKIEWPKFSGDIKKFRTWYLSITTQLSMHPWKELYDSVTHDVVAQTSNVSLNGKLYAKVLASLEGSALQNIINQKHLCANGVMLLHELVQFYQPKNIPEVIAAKTGEFWSNTKHLPNESVDNYYKRFHELLDDLNQADDPISLKSAIRHFIFTLGPKFEHIQNNFRIGNLPIEWRTQDWPTLLSLCRDYSNSINPSGLLKKSIPRDNGTNSTFDHPAHHKKVKEWFSNPSKYQKEIEQEQLKHPGKCMYHLSKTHPTDDCFVKKACANALPQSSTSASDVTGPRGHLRNIKEEDANEDIIYEGQVDYEVIDNDTNDEVLNDFTRVSNHYLRLVKSGDFGHAKSRHPMLHPVILDSGANYHMFREREFFECLHPASGRVILGDGVWSLDIQGIGTVRCKINNHTVLIKGVRFIPDLAESIYSLFLHIKLPGHSITSSFDDGLFVHFPDFTAKGIIGTSDIYLDITPFHDDTDTRKVVSVPGSSSCSF